MSLPDLVQNALHDALHRSLPAIRPELALCTTIVCLLLAQMILPRWRSGPYWVTLVGAAAALAVLEPWQWLDVPAAERLEIFTGMLVVDGLSVFLRSLLLVFLLLFVLLVWITAVPPRDDAGELFVLVVGATLGMCMMASANHLVMVVLGMEMASLPCYVLAGILRFRKPSTEAALKFALFGAGAAGIMLYGLSLLAGVLGSLHLPTLATQLALLMHSGPTAEQSLLLTLGSLMLAVGLAFKLSAVPFHFWAPDVFEGAPAEVGALLSVASKTAALGLLVRLVLAVTAPAVMAPAATADIGPAADSFPQQTTADADVAGQGSGTPAAIVNSNAARPTAILPDALAPVRRFIVGLLSLLAVVTCTFGNLAAYGQSNMKRLLAYSTIAHAGYLIMPVAAAVALTGGIAPDAPASGGVAVGNASPGQTAEADGPALGHSGDVQTIGERLAPRRIAGAAPASAAQMAVASVLFYLAVYLFMNLAAFSITAVLRNAIGSERIDDYAGLVRRWPSLVVCTALAMFSLVGLPPLAGFLAKFYIFSAVVKAELWLLLAVGGLNTVLSLFYYLRVVRAMVLPPAPNDQSLPETAARRIGRLYCIGVTIPLVALFFWSETLMQWAARAAAGTF